MTDNDDDNADYRSKRDFDRSPEPTGDEQSRENGGGRFVIQRHEASSSHFDARLEVDGVPKS